METENLQPLLTPEGQSLLAELREFAPEEELALATRLRREHSAELVSAAFGQARLRQRARAKFGADADLMYFTPNGVEQSTRRSVAEWRARRFAELGVRRLADLCCGIGGDVLALARAGIEVLAVDRDPAACAATAANAAALGLADLVEVRCADVADVDVTGYDAVFTDPARRTSRGRVFDPEAYAPPLSWAIEAYYAPRSARSRWPPASRTRPCRATRRPSGSPTTATSRRRCSGSAPGPTARTAPPCCRTAAR